jgi:hypothetical protein
MGGSGKTWTNGPLAALAALASAAPAAADAQIYISEIRYPSGPIEGSDPLVGLPMPRATAPEYRAHLLWNLRAGLNVAALSCQFSPYLRTVANYNAILAHHSRELASAYTVLEGYFRRVNGRNGPRIFDQYSTNTYNGFSTMEAQFGFCQTAARLGKEALATPKGQFGQFATQRFRELRGSLTPVADGYSFNRAPILLTPIALGPRDCSGLPRDQRRTCEGQR